MMNRTIFLLIISITFLCNFFTISNAQPLDSLSVFVWEFTTPTGERNDLTKGYTKAFERELANSLYLKDVLDRRNYDRLRAAIENENAVLHLGNIPTAQRDSLINLLQTAGANAVVFGEVDHDIYSGVIEVTITFELFNSKILFNPHARFILGERFPSAVRDSAVKALIEETRKQSLKKYPLLKKLASLIFEYYKEDSKLPSAFIAISGLWTLYTQFQYASHFDKYNRDTTKILSIYENVKNYQISSSNFYVAEDDLWKEYNTAKKYHRNRRLSMGIFGGLMAYSFLDVFIDLPPKIVRQKRLNFYTDNNEARIALTWNY